MAQRSTLRIALAQINTTVGDLDGNVHKILSHVEKARAQDCDIITFPELTITGYPPEDLVLRRQFVADQRQKLDELTANIEDIICIVGFVDADDMQLYNAAAMIYNRQVRGVYRKVQLPNYSVFDEERYFEPGDAALILNVDDIKLGISICEDIWIPDSVPETEALEGEAELLINISASPYSLLKGNERRQLMQSRAQHNHAFVIYTNLVGGQDELVFDGHSLIAGPDGSLLAEGKSFSEDFLVYDFDTTAVRTQREKSAFRTYQKQFTSSTLALSQFYIQTPGKAHYKTIINNYSSAPLMNEEAEIYRAIELGLRDYVIKNGFQHVVFGLSGGIDSALVAALAADALGAKNVHGITMPSQYSSQGSVDDSVQLAQNFGMELFTYAIQDVFASYEELLSETFEELKPDVTEENLQARIRGNLVMALSNKFGWLALATGNKSEVSVGYCTIYGDMVGGFAPLKDVNKTMVYRLAEYRNKLSGYDIIPQAIIDKAPSAELRPDQTDQDSLPPYDVLDQILELYVERSVGVRDIVKQGFSKDVVKQVARLVDINEYKRRQAAPGVKITPLAFGKDRRMPITNHYRGM